MLTPTARRMLAASMVQTANSAVDGLLVADALDATAGSILRVSGVDDTTARSILASLWTEPTAPALPGLTT
jgi:hypothetical protein